MKNNLVSIGDTIEVKVGNSKTTVIKWQQTFKKRSETFTVYTYKIKGKNMGGALFVENKLITEFSELITKSENGAEGLSVTEQFQYGQDKNKTFRFLVYHQSSEKMYQHRFLTNSLFQRLMKGVSSTLGIFPNLKTEFDIIIDQGKSYLGDPLRNFKILQK